LGTRGETFHASVKNVQLPTIAHTEIGRPCDRVHAAWQMAVREIILTVTVGKLGGIQAALEYRVGTISVQQ